MFELEYTDPEPVAPNPLRHINETYSCVHTAYGERLVPISLLAVAVLEPESYKMADGQMRPGVIVHLQGHKPLEVPGISAMDFAKRVEERLDHIHLHSTRLHAR